MRGKQPLFVMLEVQEQEKKEVSVFLKTLLGESEKKEQFSSSKIVDAYAHAEISLIGIETDYIENVLG